MKKLTLRWVTSLLFLSASSVCMSQDSSPGVGVIEHDWQYRLIEVFTNKPVEKIILRVTHEFLREDCNTYRLQASLRPSHVWGNGRRGVYKIHSSISYTLMNCPLDEPVIETIYSDPITLQAFYDQYGDENIFIGELVLENGFELEFETNE